MLRVENDLLEKGSGLLRCEEHPDPVKVFEFVEAQKAELLDQFMCEGLGVTRQRFYAWRKRPACNRRVVDAPYTEVIKRIHTESGNYGAPRFNADVADDYNIRCGRKRVARLMR